MKRVRQRAMSIMVFAAFLIMGMCLFFIRLSDDGRAWAMHRGNLGIYTQGILNRGTVTDRNGLSLARADAQGHSYADDGQVRRAVLHVVGDYGGNIGTGVLTSMTHRLANYSPINGTFDMSGAGAEIRLTIDSELQTRALAALGSRRGAVLVMDYETGEVLCMVSTPTYDPKSPPDLTGPEYDGAYINRAISSVFTPGSVFKIVTLAAAIENIRNLNSRQFYCGGSTIVQGAAVTCPRVHGTQDINDAFANSCNIAFGELSLELGADKLAAFAEDFGLCSSHELSGIPTAPGSFTKAPAGSSELAWSGIGQSENLVSPFAMLRLTGAIGNVGLLREPSLVMSDYGFLARINSKNERLMGESTANRLREMMRYNVTQSYGGFLGLEMCGKTGTAEAGDGLPHAWFTGFLADSEHPLAIVVIAERSGGGLAVAGAIANEILQFAAGR